MGRAFAAGFWVDDFWRWVSDTLVEGVTRASLFVDRKVIDRTADALGDGTYAAGTAASSLQSGRVQTYISITLGLLAGLALYLAL